MIVSRRRMMVAAAALLLVCHPFWLAWVAVPLVAHSELSPVSAVAISYGDRRFDVAANLLVNGVASEVLLFEDRRRWAVDAGVLTSLHETGRRQLLVRGVPPDRIRMLSGPTRNRWEEIDRLAAWLDEAPGRSALLLVPQFQGLATRAMLRQTLTAEAAMRVRVVSLRDRRFDTTNWWRLRAGWRTLFGGYLTWAHAVVVGHPPVRADDWDPDAFEASLRRARDSGVGAWGPSGLGWVRELGPGARQAMAEKSVGEH
ncbi:MAG: hypothetical protein AB7F89_02630 [Pirellulaceae bacterium]